METEVQIKKEVFEVNKKPWLYDNGLPWTTGTHKKSGLDKLEYTFLTLKKRIDNGKASMILIDGGLGEGKTTFAVHIASFYETTYVSLKDFLFMGSQQFLNGLKPAYERGLKLVIYDESGDFDKKGAMSKLNKMLERIFDIFRAFKIIVILVLPSFFVLDNSLFVKNIPRLLIHCHNRTKRQGNFSVYSLYRMNWLRYRATKCYVKTDAFKLVQPNFRGHFKDLDPVRSKELDSFSTRGKLGVVGETVLKSEGHVSINDLAMNSGLSKSQVKLILKSNNIKPATVFKKKHYYSREVINLVRRQRKR